MLKRIGGRFHGPECASGTSQENQRGIALTDAGKYEEAKACFEALIDQYPEDRAAYFNLGMVCLKEGKDANALECFQQLLTMEPKDEEAKKQILLINQRAGK